MILATTATTQPQLAHRGSLLGWDWSSIVPGGNLALMFPNVPIGWYVIVSPGMCSWREGQCYPNWDDAISAIREQAYLNPWDLPSDPTAA